MDKLFRRPPPGAEGTGDVGRLRLRTGVSSLLVAEEAELYRDALAALCERTGRYAVVGQCGDGATALSMIRSHLPVVALLDLDLPQLHTLELIARVISEGLPVRTVVLASRSDRKTVLECLRAGANGFVLRNGSSSFLLEALEQAAAGGVYLTPQVQADKLFVSAGRGGNPDDPIAQLSSREYQVFTLLIEGIRAKEIAARLDLSPKTVDTYRASLMRKLDIHDVAGLVKFAVKRKLVEAR